ncbi:Mucin-2 [Acipenser ruthenus]|uniref:Mucin-2 n=1 Tax=Acipenser ruthenus TaxID=7906 RepID=A0A444V0Q5_ACIRT|nr:Mucin-2 [Acipenser ruthenus]
MFDNKPIIPDFSRDGIQISNTGIEINVYIPEINAHVSFTGLVFLIQLPYSLFVKVSDTQLNSGSLRFSPETHYMMHSCTCCRETKTSEKKITLSCPDNTTVDYSYIYVEECGCQNTECVDNKTSSAPPSGQEAKEAAKGLRARRRRK